MSLTETHLYREIHDQPAVVARLLDTQRDAVAVAARAIADRDVHFVMIAARGTSDNAGRYAKYLLGASNQLPVALATPSLFTIYERPPRLRNTLVVGISQSGQSPDIVAVLAEGRRQGALTLAITNTVDSPLAQTADHVIDLCAGPERAVAATKSYTTSLAAIALLSSALSGDDDSRQALGGVPAAMRSALTVAEAVADRAERYRYMSRSVVIGRGYNYGTAYELALKLTELTYTTVEPYSSADFMHGPLALVEHGFPVVLVAPSGPLQHEMQQFAARISGLGAEVLAISDAASTIEHARVQWTVPAALPPWLSPLSMIVPGQLFAMHLAHACGYNVDQPRAIRKVTETR